MVSPDIDMSVSLIIPSFNRAHLIEETLHSALNQTCSFDEIIVVDDGSTDDTRNILKRYGGSIRVIRQSNQGVQAARNSGFYASTGSWVVFCDSDDLLLPDYLSIMVSWLGRHSNVDAVYPNFKLFGPEGVSADKLSLCPFDYLDGAVVEDGFAHSVPFHLRRNLRYQPLFLSGLIVRRERFLSIDGFDTSLVGIGAEDWEFTLRLILACNVAICIHPCVLVRRHAGNDSANQLRMSLGELQILELLAAKVAHDIELMDAIQQQIEIRSRHAFDSAFVERKFQLLPRLYETMGPANRGLKVYVKRALASLPLSEWFSRVI